MQIAYKCRFSRKLIDVTVEIDNGMHWKCKCGAEAHIMSNADLLNYLRTIIEKKEERLGFIFIGDCQTFILSDYPGNKKLKDLILVERKVR